MTPQPRLTAEEEAKAIVEYWWWNDKDQHAPLKAAIAAALRKRDELADAYWRECQAWREGLIAYEHCEYMEKFDVPRQQIKDTDAARRAAGLGEG